MTMTEREVARTVTMDVLKRAAWVRSEGQYIARQWMMAGAGMVVVVRVVELHLLSAGYTSSTAAEVARLIVQGVKP
jgi:hypothetical protein